MAAPSSCPSLNTYLAGRSFPFMASSWTVKSSPAMWLGSGGIPVELDRYYLNFISRACISYMVDLFGGMTEAHMSSFDIVLENLYIQQYDALD